MRARARVFSAPHTRDGATPEPGERSQERDGFPCLSAGGFQGQGQGEVATKPAAPFRVLSLERSRWKESIRKGAEKIGGMGG